MNKKATSGHTTRKRNSYRGFSAPELMQAHSMEELGACLRSLREHRDISLSEVASITKVKPLYLEAIERGKTERLPGGIYRRGYLRSYVSALGQDPTPWLRRFDELSQSAATHKWTKVMNSVLSSGSRRWRKMLSEVKARRRPPGLS